MDPTQLNEGFAEIFERCDGLPLLQGANGLPLGVQLVGRRGSDARLLRSAKWLTSHLEASG